MKVYLHEISDADTEIELDQETGWLAHVFREADEDKIPMENLRPNKTKPKSKRKITFNVNLRKVDDFYVVSGDLHSHVDLLCSRCASSFAFPIDEHFSHLYCQDKQMAGIAYLDKDARPKNQNQGSARHAASIPSDTQYKESTDDLEITYVGEDHINLADLIREVISLRLPYQPLHAEDCKGVCAQCGTDLNHGRCACAKVSQLNAFSALKNYPHVGPEHLNGPAPEEDHEDGGDAKTATPPSALAKALSQSKMNTHPNAVKAGPKKE